MVSTASSYAAFERRLSRLMARTLESATGFCGYASQDVAFRLVQRCAELGVFEFTRVSAEKYRLNATLPADTEAIVCGVLLFEADGTVRLKNVAAMQLLLEFFAYWCFVFLRIFASFRPKISPGRVSMLYGVGRQDLNAGGSDLRFLDFCRSGPVGPLRNADRLVVQSEQSFLSTDPMRVRYGRVPLLDALRWSGLGFRTWLLALRQHIESALGFIQALRGLPLLLLLGRDAANHAVAAALNRGGNLQDVILTNSDYFSQPLWFWALPHKRFASHIVWYSQNGYPISYVDEREAVSIPNLRYVRADVQWVWNDGFKNFLEAICPKCDFEVVSPVIWCLPSKTAILARDSPRIALFDVTPVSELTEQKFGLLRNFYSESVMSGFIRDVVEVAQAVGSDFGISIEIVLKHKRHPKAGFHSSSYFDVVEKFVQDGSLKVIDPASNMFDFVSASDVVIAAPYSSPVYVGRHLVKNSFWYDPTENLDWKLEVQEIPLVQGRERLRTKMMESFVNPSMYS